MYVHTYTFVEENKYNEKIITIRAPFPEKEKKKHKSTKSV